MRKVEMAMRSGRTKVQEKSWLVVKEESKKGIDVMSKRPGSALREGCVEGIC